MAPSGAGCVYHGCEQWANYRVRRIRDRDDKPLKIFPFFRPLPFTPERQQ